MRKLTGTIYLLAALLFLTGTQSTKSILNADLRQIYDESIRSQVEIVVEDLVDAHYPLEAKRAILNSIIMAARAETPTSRLISKVQEGIAKEVDPGRLQLVIRRMKSEFDTAKGILSTAAKLGYDVGSHLNIYYTEYLEDIAEALSYDLLPLQLNKLIRDGKNTGLSFAEVLEYLRITTKISSIEGVSGNQVFTLTELAITKKLPASDLYLVEDFLYGYNRDVYDLPQKLGELIQLTRAITADQSFADLIDSWRARGF